MKSRMIILLLLSSAAVVSLTGCKKGSEAGFRENQPVKEIYPLSDEALNYFVNYEIGTKWIYEDTLGNGILDTIELISKKPYNTHSGDQLYAGYELYYRPVKTKDFKVRITTGRNQSYYVKVDPLEAATGMITAEYRDGKWTGDEVKDSMKIKDKVYHDAFQFHPFSQTSYHARFVYAKNIGLVSFWKMDNAQATFVLKQIVEP